MAKLAANSEFWDYALPQLLLAPMSMPVSDVLRCFEDASGLDESVDYRDLSSWTRWFVGSGLWANKDVDARCRALAAALIAERNPHARLRLFNLLELWAWGYASDIAAQIEDHLRWSFDLEREVELDPVDQLRALASVCTLLGAEHMAKTGLAVLVDDETSITASAQNFLDRLLRRGDLNSPDGLQLHGPTDIELTAIRSTDPAALSNQIANSLAQFFAAYTGYLSGSQHLFVIEDLRPALDALLVDAELHQVHSERELTCCGGALYLLALRDRWLAIQIYRYC